VRVYGIGARGIYGRKLEEIAHDPGGARRRLEQVSTKESSRISRPRTFAVTGRWFHLLIKPISNRYQGRKAILSIDRDITEGKRAGEALLQAEQKYREIFENVGEGIFQTTPEGRFITANPALARMLGFVRCGIISSASQRRIRRNEPAFRGCLENAFANVFEDLAYFCSA